MLGRELALLDRGLEGRTLIWPAQVTLGEVGSSNSGSALLALVLNRGLERPRKEPAVRLVAVGLDVTVVCWWRWWGCRLGSSAGREGLHIGLGMRAKRALEGKQTSRSVWFPALFGAAAASFPFMECTGGAVGFCLPVEVGSRAEQSVREGGRKDGGDGSRLKGKRFVSLSFPSLLFNLPLGWLAPKFTLSF